MGERRNESLTWCSPRGDPRITITQSSTPFDLLDLRHPDAACLFIVHFAAAGHGTPGRGKRPLALVHLFGVSPFGHRAEGMRTIDVPSVPVGGDGRDVSHPALSAGHGSLGTRPSLWTQLCWVAITSAASTRPRSSMASRSVSALAMSGSVTPWARGTRPAIRLAVFWRRAAAAWLKRSTRLWRTEATSDSVGQGPHGDDQRDSGVDVDATRLGGPQGGEECPVPRSHARPSGRPRRGPAQRRPSKRSAWASVARVRYSAESRSMAFGLVHVGGGSSRVPPTQRPRWRARSRGPGTPSSLGPHRRGRSAGRGS